MADPCIAADEMPSEDIEMEGTDLPPSNGLGNKPSNGDGNLHSRPTQPPENIDQTNHTQVKLDTDEKQPISSSPPPNGDSNKMKSASRKKGTASKKGPKKSRSSKSKTHSKKGTSTTDPTGGAHDASSDDETDNGPYCICRGPDDHRWMISCDVCEDWFHGECVSLNKDVGENLVERFVCPNCTDGKRNYTKYKKTCSLADCKNPARLYTKTLKDRSVFCCNDHCDAWWINMINTLPTKAASEKAIEVLTQEDFVGLLVNTAEQSSWKLGDQPFGNMEGLWSNGLPTRSGVLSGEEQAFLKSSSAERLALGNEIVQYKKMMQLIDWANHRRQLAIEAGKFTKESCGYDWRLDTVSVRHQFSEWLETPEGQAIFKTGRLDAPLDPDLQGEPATRGMCEKKRCKPHNLWYKLLMSAVRTLIKETATAAADKLNSEDVMRQAAEARFERRQLEKNSVEILDG
ncbi:uncharacterized protein GGS22DRAFT_160010 [Annulohypoxylon maeteangense]|uniref:uncharacterized protein n=1 Tax=Annulohypoxylon maeteangense TaxID=1927788 RepID=UPI002007ED78|nr:uncharacterized protein GGS22DRAFT_160010 [Annulohypoxylon maeteangense]KAI0886134.1 hypothetical protein GGS22DRAFT_160010 [Annulohypoxylon maeteangense]